LARCDKPNYQTEEDYKTHHGKIEEIFDDSKELATVLDAIVSEAYLNNTWSEEADTILETSSEVYKTQREVCDELINIYLIHYVFR